MTREEAMNMLRGLVASYPLKHDEWQAVEFAIKALQESESIAKSVIEASELLRKRIRRWVPCSERLPEKLGDYLVTDNYGNVYSSTFNYVLKEKCFGHEDDDGLFIKNNRVIAWMPLPEPYMKEGDEK